MLSEALSYLLAKCQKKYKSLGYLREAIAIEARYKRCHRAWADHLKISQEEIINAVEKTAGRNRVVVLGAGSGFDIPLDFLLSKFTEIHLVDVIFLKPVLRLAQKYPQITLIEKDVTGIIEQLVGGKGEAMPSSLNQKPPESLLAGADLVVSCNLLSQLPLNIKNWLVDQNAGQGTKEIDRLCRAIISSHLSWLETCPAPVLLITDLEQHLVPMDRSKKTIRENALFGLGFENMDRLWLWNIAPCPEVDKHYSLHHQVGALYLPRETKFDVVNIS